MRNFITLGCFILFGSSMALGQYPSPYARPVAGYPYGYGAYPPVYQNRLSGSADVLNAQGNVLLDQEKSRIMREQATQEKLKTKRQTFDEMMYEKANKISPNEQREYDQANIVRRMMIDPAIPEIKDGRAANTMMPFINDLMMHGIQGPTVDISSEMLKEINIKTGETGPELGPLREGGNLTWPFALRGKSTAKLDKLLPRAVDAAGQGTLEPELYREVKGEVAQLKLDFPKKYLVTQEIDTGEYLEGKHFLESLEKGVEALRQPNAKRLFNGSLRAQGNTVPELVAFMSQNGLKFAPASPGKDDAYFALHSAMVAYASAAQNSAGFRVPIALPAKLESYKK